MRSRSVVKILGLVLCLGAASLGCSAYAADPVPDEARPSLSKEDHTDSEHEGESCPLCIDIEKGAECPVCGMYIERFKDTAFEILFDTVER